MPHRGPISIRIESDPSHLCVVRAAVETAASRFGLPPQDCDRLVLAVDEAMTNIIRHGYGGRSDQPIWVTLSRLVKNGHSGIRVVIDDVTEDPNPAAIKAKALPDQSTQDLKPGGLGISIIQQIVDEYVCECRKDAIGLRQTLEKYASQEDATSQAVKP